MPSSVMNKSAQEHILFPSQRSHFTVDTKTSRPPYMVKGRNRCSLIFKPRVKLQTLWFPLDRSVQACFKPTLSGVVTSHRCQPNTCHRISRLPTEPSIHLEHTQGFYCMAWLCLHPPSSPLVPYSIQIITLRPHRACIDPSPMRCRNMKGMCKHQGPCYCCIP